MPPRVRSSASGVGSDVTSTSLPASPSDVSPSAPPFDIRAAKRRGWWTVVALLVATNLFTALVGWWVIRTVDSAYRNVTDDAVPALADLRDLTQGSAQVHRYLLNMLVTTNPEERRLLLRLIAQVREQNSALLDSVAARLGDGPDGQLVRQVRAARSDYIAVSSEFQEAAVVGDFAQALEIQRTELRSRYDTYQARLRILGEQAATRIVEEQAFNAAQAGFLSRVVLGMGAVPLIAVLALGVTSLGLLFSLRRDLREMNW